MCALPSKDFDSTCNMHSKCVSIPVNKFIFTRLAAVRSPCQREISTRSIYIHPASTGDTHATRYLQPRTASHAPLYNFAKTSHALTR